MFQKHVAYVNRKICSNNKSNKTSGTSGVKGKYPVTIITGVNCEIEQQKSSKNEINRLLNAEMDVITIKQKTKETVTHIYHHF